MRLFIKILVGFVLVFCSFYVVYDMTLDNEEISLPYEIVSEANIDEYYVYGTTFNLKGNISLDYGYSNINLLLYDINEESEKRIPLIDEKQDNNIKFYLTDEINNGFSLEQLDRSKYYVLLEVIISEEDTRYYSLKNLTNYEESFYYTLSKRNNKIVFSTDNKFNTFYLNVIKNRDPDVYDIVLDAGHGGKDSGAYINGNNEKDINLAITLELAEKLEKKGIKVFLTRDKDAYLNNYSIDGKKSRVTLINESNAKYVLSLHLNSSSSKKASGVEVYTNPNINYDFAMSIADKIVEYASSSYSINMTNKMYNGVYTRLLTKENIETSYNEAIQKGILPYNIKENTAYYFIIREPGGIVTNAYVDGTDPEVGINSYYNSNIGVEGYLVEMGYLTNNNDYQNLTTNANYYVDALYQAIIQELGY